MSQPSIKTLCMDNVVCKEKLRDVQGRTLNQLSSYISATYGPLGSNTMIVSGNDKSTILSNYSKDGLKVLKNITFSEPLEMAIHSEIVDIAKFVEHQVGDGTTSSIILSSKIFEGLSNIEKEETIPPRTLVKVFQNIVEKLQNIIMENKKDITIDDIYKICMISTNGNTEVSENIKSLYEKYGFDVSIDVGISNDTNTKVKIYDGLTINEGYSDPAYINNKVTGTAEIHNARIYAFEDPIDTPEMVSFMEKILLENIFTPASQHDEVIPTVIISPHISRDASGLLTKLVTLLYSYNEDNMESQKPPVLVLTNITGTDEGIYHDISNLCRCKIIRKYIDPTIQAADQEKGDAPTLDNIVDWYGTADAVIADSDKTKFIRPAAMADENDNSYEMLKNFLKAEIKKSTEDNDDHLTVGRLKKRLRCLEANMIEYLIGGITISDRDSLRDLVEDAVKNCASASEFGVGYAANYEGLRAAVKLSESSNLTALEKKLIDIIIDSYKTSARILYSTATDSDRANTLIKESIECGHPFNVMDVFNGTEYVLDDYKCNVLCSIRTDVEILNAISKIITMMVTANQCLLQVPALNRY